MSWMELFETVVNGFRQELRLRGCEGSGFDSENKCGKNLFINLIFRFVCESYLLLNIR